MRAERGREESLREELLGTREILSTTLEYPSLRARWILTIAGLFLAGGVLEILLERQIALYNADFSAQG